MAKYGKFDFEKTKHLRQLREAHELTQQDVASFFGIKSRDAVSRWENGENAPSGNKRERFIDYLLDKVSLRQDLAGFVETWQLIMVGEWGWPPLKREELEGAFPGKVDGVSQFGNTIIINVVAPAEKKAVSWKEKRPFLISSGIVAALIVATLIYFLLPSSPLVVEQVEATSGERYLVRNNKGCSEEFQVSETFLEVGSCVYTDRNFTYIEVPNFLEGLEYINPANNDKRAGLDDEPFSLTFNVNKDVTVYVAYDARFTTNEMPTWLREFQIIEGSDTKLVLGPPSRKDPTTLNVYYKTFPAGTVTLGPNMTSIVEDSDNKTMYTVMIREQ